MTRGILNSQEMCDGLYTGFDLTEFYGMIEMHLPLLVTRNLDLLL